MVTAFQFFFAYLIVDALCVALTIIMASKISRDAGSETQIRYFFFILTAFLVFAVFDALWAFIAYSGLVDAPEEVLSLVNGINLTAIGFDAYFWLCFTLVSFGSRLTDNRAMRLLFAVPAILVPIVHIIGYFTNQNVITLPDGTWTYGICHMIITSIHLLYIAAATVVAIHKYRHATTYSQRHMCLVFIAFMVPFVVAGIVDALVVNTPIATACIMVSLAFVMMSMQEARISTDALTGLNNRRRAKAFLEESVAHASPEHPLHVFLVDLDDFKDINDTFGHLEGDHALQLTANALRSVCGQTNAFTARLGGDEFVSICTEPIVDPDCFADLIKNTLSDTMEKAQTGYNLTCSIGYALCTSPDESLSTLLNQADERLYVTKRSRGVRR